MKYRQAKKIVLKYFPTAKLRCKEARQEVETRWFDCSGNRSRVTTSVRKEYRVCVGGVPLIKEAKPTKAQAWIAVVSKMVASSLPKETVVKRYPLYEAWKKRDIKHKAKRLGYQMKKRQLLNKVLPVVK